MELNAKPSTFVVDFEEQQKKKLLEDNFVNNVFASTYDDALLGCWEYSESWAEEKSKQMAKVLKFSYERLASRITYLRRNQYDCSGTLYEPLANYFRKGDKAFRFHYPPLNSPFCKHKKRTFTEADIEDGDYDTAILYFRQPYFVYLKEHNLEDNISSRFLFEAQKSVE